MRCINGKQFLYWYTSFVSYRNDRKYRLISLLTRSTFFLYRPKTPGKVKLSWGRIPIRHLNRF